MTGRPTSYTQEIADRLCDRLADGESVRTICASDDMPGQTTVYRWLAAHEEFREQYAHAREMQADTIFDEILDIADNSANDWMERNEEGSEATLNGDHVRRSQIRIDARKWMAGKLRPKKYGDRIQNDHTVTVSDELKSWLGG